MGKTPKKNRHSRSPPAGKAVRISWPANARATIPIVACTGASVRDFDERYEGNRLHPLATGGQSVLFPSTTFTNLSKDEPMPTSDILVHSLLCIASWMTVSFVPPGTTWNSTRVAIS